MKGFLKVHNLSKSYKHYDKPSSRLIEWMSFKRVRKHRLHHILQNINFEINPGESIGIIGQNGAGKSTLLKLIVGTTRPTEGMIQLTGRVAALLELGMGFHPNCTGKENVFMAGQLLGFSTQEIAACFSDIEQFAGIGEYMNQPLRIYSSGMQVRLAFSIATAIRPDILIIDEALSVGDIHFQQKCYERIAQFKELGTTLIFVSHDLIALNTLCDRVLYLKDSQVAYDGVPSKAIDSYHADFYIKPDSIPPKSTEISSISDENAIGSLQSDRAQLVNVEILSNGLPTSSVVSDAEVTLSIKILFLQAFNDPHVGFKIRDRLGIVLFETNSFCMRKRIGAVRQNELVATQFTFKMGLISGEYTITVGVANEGFAQTEFREPLIYAPEVAKCTVLKNYDTILWAGIYNLSPEFSCIKEPSTLGLVYDESTI